MISHSFEVKNGDVIFTTSRVRYAGSYLVSDETEIVSLKQLIREVLRENQKGWSLDVGPP